MITVILHIMLILTLTDVSEGINILSRSLSLITVAYAAPAQSSETYLLITSQDVDAQQLHDEARQYFEKARKASEAGDKAAAKAYIDKAKATMLEASKTLGNKKLSQEKDQKDYQERYESVKALLDALDRVNKEKESTPSHEKEIREKMIEAQKVYASGNIKQAKAIIDNAFNIAKQSLILLRDGDTLVRSLNFASKEEEYHYEIDRNNTHEMLVKVLLKERMNNPKVASQVNANMDKAHELRAQAEQLAKQGKFAEAVETMENATGQILRSIRAAGVYIPG